MKTYCVGLFFTADLKKVALLRKLKPAWQAGKLNGVGGHVEDGETFRQAMVREFREESGVLTYESDWKLIVEQTGHDYALSVFVACHATTQEPEFIKADEQVEWYDVETLGARTDVIPNIKWFMWLALDHATNKPIQVTTS